MYTTVVVSVLATISVLIGLSLILPDVNIAPKIPDSASDSEPNDTPPTKSELTQAAAPSTKSEYPDSCYDAITVREKGRVYIFQSKRPLQEGVNPRIFPDLPSYRVWAERSLGEGIRCPVLYYEPSSSPYVHPEEKYAGNGMANSLREVRAAKSGGALPDTTVTVTYETNAPPGTSQDVGDSTLQRTRDTKSSYVRSAVMEPARYVGADGIQDDISPPTPPYAEARGPVSRELYDNLIERSQREAAGIGADQPAPIPSRNQLRDVPDREIAALAAEMEEKDPSMRGMVLKRTGYSKYEVDEIIPERAGYETRGVTDSGVYASFGMGNMDGLSVDLLAYGGTVVPVKSVNRLFG